jgi:hypothetical protein
VGLGQGRRQLPGTLLIVIQQDDPGGRRADPGKGARISRQLLLHLLRRKNGIHSRGNGAQPVYRAEGLDQHDRSRPLVRAAGPGRRYRRQIAVPSFATDHDQMRKPLGWYAAGGVGSGGEANLVTGASQLLCDAIPLGAGTHDDQGSGSDGASNARGVEPRGRGRDSRRQPPNDLAQLTGIRRPRSARKQSLSFASDGADLGKAEGAS